MDLAKLTAVERTVEILTPSKQETGLFVTLVGPDDAKLKRIKEATANEMLSLQAKGKAIKADKLEYNRRMVLFTAMTGWEWKGEAAFDGEKPEFNQKNVFEVFEKLPWVLNAIDSYFDESESFFAQPLSGS